jgi:hypothetical protein
LKVIEQIEPQPEKRTEEINQNWRLIQNGELMNEATRQAIKR